MTALISMLHVTLPQDGCPHHVIHASCAVFVLTSLHLALFTVSLSSSFSILLIFIFISHVGRFGEVFLCASANEVLGTLADNTPLTGYQPNVLDNFHISETTELLVQESSSDSRPSNLHDLEIDGRPLSSPLFTREREDDASRRQAHRSPDEGLSSSQSLSVGHVRTGRPVPDQFGSSISNVREKSAPQLRK